MDPAANLSEQREISARLLADAYASDADYEADAQRLAELVQALDEWRRRGGFDPYQTQTSQSLIDAVRAEFDKCKRKWDSEEPAALETLERRFSGYIT